jgi:ribosomal protein S18 acetylase RimI-like enzyme
MHIERATQADDELVAAFARLIPQLTPTAPLPGRDDLARVVASPDTHLLIARDPGIVGSLTLTLLRLPTGLQGRINAVVVDAEARGRGIGEALTREAVQIAQLAGVRRITLSSRSEREAAHRMYRRVGFEPAITSSFQMWL